MGKYVCEIEDEFLDLQNQIATKLASELKGGLDASEVQQLAKKATNNPEAHSEYKKVGASGINELMKGSKTLLNILRRQLS